MRNLRPKHFSKREIVFSPASPRVGIVRGRVVGAILFLAFAGLIGRLWYLQIARGEDYLHSAQANDTRTLRLRAARGVIVASDGEVLASNRSQFAVYALPSVAYDSATLARIAGILGENKHDIAALLKSQRKNNYDPVRIALDVSDATVAEVEENQAFLPGVSSEPEPVRWYPLSSFLAATLGTLGHIDVDQYRRVRAAGYFPDDFVGKTGLEEMYEAQLHGSPGGTIVKVNARGRPTQILGEKQPKQGDTVVLCVNPKVESAAENALASHDWVGAAVAVDPRTGAVLAMASSPSFDPNLFATGVDQAHWRAIARDPNKPLLNRPIEALYPPGSTFKQVVAAAGLESGAIGTNTSVYCPGYLMLGKARFGCWETHGEVDFYRAIADSCDVFFYKAGLAIGPDNLAAFARQYPLAQATGIDMPHEKIGSIPSPAWKVMHFGSMGRQASTWYGGDTLNMSIGQGYVLATPLQMALVTAATANGGQVLRPYLVSRIYDPTTGADQMDAQTTILRTIHASPDVLAAVREGMRDCVTNGTGKIVDFSQVEVAAKTGSAQVGEDVATDGWFVAFAPYDHPTIAVAAIVEHGGHGGDTAGVVCRAMLQAYFGLKDEQAQFAKSD